VIRDSLVDVLDRLMTVGCHPVACGPRPKAWKNAPQAQVANFAHNGQTDLRAEAANERMAHRYEMESGLGPPKIFPIKNRHVFEPRISRSRSRARTQAHRPFPSPQPASGIAITLGEESV
jgi:hypothetical protein